MLRALPRACVRAASRPRTVSVETASNRRSLFAVRTVIRVSNERSLPVTGTTSDECSPRTFAPRDPKIMVVTQDVTWNLFQEFHNV